MKLNKVARDLKRVSCAIKGNNATEIAESKVDLLRIIEEVRSSTYLQRHIGSKVARVQLRYLDPFGASDMARRAASAGCAEAALLAEKIGGVIREAGDLADAAKGCPFGLQTVDSGEVDIMLPIKIFDVTAFSGASIPQDIRAIYQTILTILRKSGVSIRICGLPGGIREILMGDHKKRYVSYHTYSQKNGGLHINATDQPSQFSFDFRGYAGVSEFAYRSLGNLGIENIDEKEVTRFFHREHDRIISGHVSRYAQNASLGIDIDQPYIFVPLQIADEIDPPAYMTMEDMLNDIIHTAKLHGLLVVVKRHPRSKDKNEEAWILDLQKKGSVVESGGSIHNLIRGAIAVCTLNSNVGAEAMIHQKPVYLFGSTSYRHVCFVIMNRGEFSSMFDPEKLPVPTDVLMRYLFLYRSEFSIDVSDRGRMHRVLENRLDRLLSRQS